ncbi:MAG: GNAT family N-acetyltransferase [Vicinamibacterales bacterium]
MNDLVIRQATPADAEAMHALIQAHLDEGHLLPRPIDDLRGHAARFTVCEIGDRVMACGELAPLSPSVAEVRSLVVARDTRRAGLAGKVVAEIRRRAAAAGYQSLCAFTHDPRFFVRQDFSIVPHVWLPEKISTDCLACPLFRRCQQYAMLLPLDHLPRYGAADRTVAAVA